MACLYQLSDSFSTALYVLNDMPISVVIDNFSTALYVLNDIPISVVMDSFSTALYVLNGMPISVVIDCFSTVPSFLDLIKLAQIKINWDVYSRVPSTWNINFSIDKLNTTRLILWVN
jgi:hypothetical protein